MTISLQTNETLSYMLLKNLLSNDKRHWQKKGDSLLDVTMGSYDSAETCGLVGSFLLSQLQEKFGNKIGLYRDDSLAITDTTTWQTENIKKDICCVFRLQLYRVQLHCTSFWMDAQEIWFCGQSFPDSSFRCRACLVSINLIGGPVDSTVSNKQDSKY